MEENLTEEQRTLAYHVATLVDEKELHHIFGGTGHFIIPTIIVTGGPLVPDTARDSA